MDGYRERTRDYDPGNAYSINYMWGTTGIGYNVDMIKAALATRRWISWELFFKPENLRKFADCGVHVLDAATR